MPVAIQSERGITMAQDNCAAGAPPGRHKPTGFRRLTPGLLKARIGQPAHYGIFRLILVSADAFFVGMC